MIIVGTYKLEDVIKTLDMTHKKHSSGNRASLSEYYLTDWILNWSAANAQTLTYSDGTFGISDSGGVISYPINRLTGVTKITFKARRTGYTMYFDGSIFKIIDGEAVIVGNYSATLGTSWTEFEVDIDNDTVDYFEAYAGGGYGAYVEIKDVVLTVSNNGGGAGSGYIGNSLLSNKKMVGYNVPTSSVESTKTESVNEVSANAVSGKPKSGNGFARIKLLSESKTVTYKSIAKTSDMTHYVTGGDGSNANIKGAFSSYKNTDYILWSAISSSMYSRERPFDYNNSTGIFSFNSTNYAASGFYGYVLFPFIPKSKILKVSFKVRIQTNSSTDFGVRLRDTDLNSSTMLTMFLSDPATQMDWTTVEYTVPDIYRNTEYGWLQMHFQAKAEVKDIVFTYLE